MRLSLEVLLSLHGDRKLLQKYVTLHNELEEMADEIYVFYYEFFDNYAKEVDNREYLETLIQEYEKKENEFQKFVEKIAGK